MIDPNTPAGTKMLCVDVRGCFSSCACGGGHDLGPLKEGRIYTLRAVRTGVDDVRANAGYAVCVEEIDRSNEEYVEPGYAPDRFVPLKPRWRATRRVERAPMRSEELEDA